MAQRRVAGSHMNNSGGGMTSVPSQGQAPRNMDAQWAMFQRYLGARRNEDTGIGSRADINTRRSMGGRRPISSEMQGVFDRSDDYKEGVAEHRGYDPYDLNSIVDYQNKQNQFFIEQAKLDPNYQMGDIPETEAYWQMQKDMFDFIGNLRRKLYGDRHGQSFTNPGGDSHTFNDPYHTNPWGDSYAEGLKWMQEKNALHQSVLNDPKYAGLVAGTSPSEAHAPFQYTNDHTDAFGGKILGYRPGNSQHDNNWQGSHPGVGTAPGGVTPGVSPNPPNTGGGGNPTPPTGPVSNDGSGIIKPNQPRPEQIGLSNALSAWKNWKGQ
jgi:hypothetical protein